MRGRYSPQRKRLPLTPTLSKTMGRGRTGMRGLKMSDWRKDVPFPRHWLIYVIIKIAIVALAVYLAVKHGYIWQ